MSPSSSSLASSTPPASANDADEAVTAATDDAADAQSASVAAAPSPVTPASPSTSAAALAAASESAFAAASRPEEPGLLPLLAHLERIDLLLQQRMHLLRRRDADRNDMNSLVLSEEELAHRQANPQGVPRWFDSRGQEPASPEWADGQPAGTGARNHIAAGTKTEDRLQTLVTTFKLSPTERDILLLSAMPLFDSRYRLLFSFLQDDRQKQWPTIELALSLFAGDGDTGSSVSEQLKARTLLLPHATLMSRGLLHYSGKRDAAIGLPEGLQIDPTVFAWLLGEGPVQTNLEPGLRWLASTAGEALTVYPGWTEQLVGLWSTSADATSPVVMLRAGEGSGQEAALTTAAARAGRPVLQVDLALLPEQEMDALPLLIYALRDASLFNACLILKDVPDLQEKRPRVFARIADLLSASTVPVACLIDLHSPVIWLGSRPQVLMELPQRTLSEDQAILACQLADSDCEANIDTAGLARRFRITAESLQQTLREARQYRSLRAPDAKLSNDDLYQAFRLRAQQNFGKLAQRVTPRRTFDDLIISEELHQKMHEILAAIRHRDHVLEQGFGKKLNYGLGISALFHGDSGTGKTMVAEVLAGVLGVDLIKVDLSTVVNKYIGETEKNISRIFDLASADAGVLFFDEADALFGKRSETKDAQDRHANIEVSYLLQRLEAYPGLVVLATNNRSHLDEAFTRRLTFITRFTFPDEGLRERMWRSIWPAGQALDADVDFARLGAAAKITGANIRNVALLATWLAVDERVPVAMRHIDQALRRELEKLGRLSFSSLS